MSKTEKYARNFDRSINDWRQLYTDADAKFDKVIKLDVTNLEPQVTWEQILKWVLVLIHLSKIKILMMNALINIWA